MSTLINELLLPDLNLVYLPLPQPQCPRIYVSFLPLALAPELELVSVPALVEQVVLPVPAVIL